MHMADIAYSWLISFLEYWRTNKYNFKSLDTWKRLLAEAFACCICSLLVFITVQLGSFLVRAVCTSYFLCNFFFCSPYYYHHCCKPLCFCPPEMPRRVWCMAVTWRTWILTSWMTSWSTTQRLCLPVPHPSRSSLLWKAANARWDTCRIDTCIHIKLMCDERSGTKCLPCVTHGYYSLAVSEIPLLL